MTIRHIALAAAALAASTVSAVAQTTPAPTPADPAPSAMSQMPGMKPEHTVSGQEKYIHRHDNEIKNTRARIDGLRRKEKDADPAQRANLEREVRHNEDHAHNLQAAREGHIRQLHKEEHPAPHAR